MKKMQAKIQAIFELWRQQNPSPKTELVYANHFQLLVAVILSAQSTDKMVNQVTEPLFKTIKGPQDVLKLDLPTLTQALSRLGLHQQKAKHIWQMSHDLINKFNGKLPQTREALESLPGVGRKTANVVLNTAFRQEEMAVDTHIFRVARRLGWSQGRTPLAVEQDLLRLIPKEFLLDAHHWMILHGRYVCKAKRPECQNCLISPWCPSKTLNE
jgi:endonuclease-3